MSFKFNFNDTEDDVNSAKVIEDAAKPEPPAKRLCVHQFQEIQSSLSKDLDMYKQEAYPFHTVNLYHVSQKDVEDELRQKMNTEISTAFRENSDLVPNVYEGGLKIWECSIDLVEYFEEEEIDFKNKSVLELGCGAGFPALYALKKGAKCVHFSDYNEDVIRNITIPNVHLNCKEDSLTHDNCCFYAGDWSYLQGELMKKGVKYDIILTSETIYSPESYVKLHDVMEALLDDQGKIYLAAKTYYFGVGGGMRDFEELLSKKNCFDYEICKIIDQGVNREIMTLWKKKRSATLKKGRIEES